MDSFCRQYTSSQSSEGQGSGYRKSIAFSERSHYMKSFRVQESKCDSLEDVKEIILDTPVGTTTTYWYNLLVDGEHKYETDPLAVIENISFDILSIQSEGVYKTFMQAYHHLEIRVRNYIRKEQEIIDGICRCIRKFYKAWRAKIESG